METKYSFWKGLGKVVLEAVIWFGPLAIQLLPDAVSNLTLSAILRLIVNYMKVKYTEGELKGV